MGKTLCQTNVATEYIQMQLAREAGYRVIIILGEPGYYPKHGFKNCSCFNIATADGKNFDAFTGIELIPGGLSGVHGKFHEASVFENLQAEEVEEFDLYLFFPIRRL